MARTPRFQCGNTGSIPVGATLKIMPEKLGAAPPAEQSKELPKKEESLEKTWLESLKERFGHLFRREWREEKLPTVALDIFYSAHGEEKDLEGFEEKFKKADIYIPEFFGWNETNLKEFRNIAEGKQQPKEFEYLSGFAERQYSILYNSHKPITFIDLPKDHQLVNQVLSHLNKDYLIHRERTSDFQEFLGRVKDWHKRWAELQRQRENYMLSQLEPSLKQLLKKRPELRQKEKLKVLMSLGSLHTGLYHQLLKQGRAAARTFSRSPYIYSNASELTRRYFFHKDVDDLLAARAWLEEVLEQEISPIDNVNTEEAWEFLSSVAEEFSLAEIKELFTLGQDKVWPWLQRKLKEKGIEIESSEQSKQ